MWNQLNLFENGRDSQLSILRGLCEINTRKNERNLG